MKVHTPVAAIRRTCLDCAAGHRKFIKFCTCDGLHSIRCHLWPYRLGMRPSTVRDQRLVTPECMPSADIPLEEVSEADLQELPTPAVRRKPR